MSLLEYPKTPAKWYDISPKCPKCSYDLTGINEWRCPECGVEVDPEDAFRWAWAPPVRAHWRLIGGLGATVGSLFIMVILSGHPPWYGSALLNYPSLFLLFTFVLFLLFMTFGVRGVLQAFGLIFTRNSSPPMVHDALAVCMATGAYALFSGATGSIIGMVLLLMSLSDPSSIGPALATSLLSMLYGLMLASVAFATGISLQRRIGAPSEAAKVSRRIFAVSGIAAFLAVGMSFLCAGTLFWALDQLL